MNQNSMVKLSIFLKGFGPGKVMVDPIERHYLYTGVGNVNG